MFFFLTVGYSSICRPSTYLGAQGIKVIRRLFVTNYDEDHIADLPMLRRYFKIEMLTRNSSINSAQLRKLKTPPISQAMDELLEMIDSYTGSVSSDQLEPPGIRVQTFHNNYPSFTDTNNLSLLNFFGLDHLERPGWLELLKNSQVRALLRRINIFVASHHGRESGYCKEVFNYCSPQFVIMSDGPVQYGTQKMAGIYGQHATGGWFNGQIRKVLTTRNDGNLLWQIN